MMKSLVFLTTMLGTVAVLACLPAQAQTKSTNVIAAPDYSSGGASAPLSDGKFYTSESDGRPGVKFFALGVQALRKGDYRHAVEMYKVAASWAYKPAEYNLGIMYFKGQGVPVDRPLGAAWMVLAAERGTPLYVRARNVMVTALSKEEFARTDELWSQLKPTYGDAVALARAKAEWIRTGRSATGSHLGHGMGELLVGNGGIGGTQAPQTNPATHTIGRPVPQTAWGVFGGQSVVDGSIAYQQFQQSDNPYDPIFLKNRTGHVTVEPMQLLEHGKHPSEQKPVPSSSTQPPRNA